MVAKVSRLKPRKPVLPVPMYDRILCVLAGEAQSKIGSIIIPDGAKEKPPTYLVKAIGCGHRLPDGSLAPLKVKEGDIVLLPKYTGQPLKLADSDGGQVEYVIIREDEVLAVLP